MPSASKLKLADALASGDTRAIIDLTSRIASRAAVAASTDQEDTSAMPCRQATAQRQ